MLTMDLDRSLIVVGSILTMFALFGTADSRFSRRDCVYDNVQEVVVCSNAACTEKDGVTEFVSGVLTLDGKDGFTLSVKTDKENGVMHVTSKINAMNSRVTGLEVLLLVNETKPDANECSEGSVNANTYRSVDNVHSKTCVDLKWSNNSSGCSGCRNNVTVTFEYIYSTCYYVVIHYFNSKNKSIGHFTSRGFMQHTQYKKEPLWNKVVTRSRNCFFDKRSIYVTFSEIDGLLTASQSKIVFKHRETEERKNFTLVPCYITRRNTSIICDNTTSATNRNFIAECHWDNAFPKTHPNINCVLSKTAPGHYSVDIYYYDSRCVENTLWTARASVPTPCTFSGYLCQNEFIGNYSETMHTMVNTGSPESLFTTNLIIIIIILILLLSISTIVIYCIKSKVSGMNNNSTKQNRIQNAFLATETNCSNSELQIPKEEINILLIYARDCAQFMKAMNWFRKVLQKFNCEVLDFWDSNRYDEVARSPETWLMSSINNKSVQVIIVANECSKLLEKYDNVQYTVEYKTDLCDLFLYALRVFNSQLVTNEYRDIYVVSLNESWDGKEIAIKFENLCQLRVHLLPKQLENLLLLIHRQDPSRFTIDLNDPDVEEFGNALKEYSRYKRNNPNYVNNILKCNQ